MDREVLAGFARNGDAVAVHVFVGQQQLQLLAVEPTR